MCMMNYKVSTKDFFFAILLCYLILFTLIYPSLWWVEKIELIDDTQFLNLFFLIGDET